MKITTTTELDLLATPYSQWPDSAKDALFAVLYTKGRHEQFAALTEADKQAYLVAYKPLLTEQVEDKLAPLPW